MSFTSPQSGGGATAGASPHMTFGDHLLQAVGAASPTLGGILGLAGVHQSAQPTQTAQPVTPYNPAGLTAFNNAPLADYSAVGQSNAKPEGGSVVGNLLSALMG